MIKLIVDGEERKFETTIFPDGTSQVWKLDLAPDEGDEISILWLFENEAEFMHVCQLANLLEVEYDYSPDLICPYLPYARQDKDVTNGATFALNTFIDVLYHRGICRIETFDAHSNQDMVYPMKTSVKSFHDHILRQQQYHIICFPDKGAASRYQNNFNNEEWIVYFEKIRNQQTGEITGLHLETNGKQFMMNDTNILIVDDICDGGMTFIKVAEALKQYNPKQIDLAVSHGLFSKGKQVLHNAGITNIYTTNSLLRNPEGFKVW